MYSQQRENNRDDFNLGDKKFIGKHVDGLIKVKDKKGRPSNKLLYQLVVYSNEGGDVYSALSLFFVKYLCRVFMSELWLIDTAIEKNLLRSFIDFKTTGKSVLVYACFNIASAAINKKPGIPVDYKNSVADNGATRTVSFFKSILKRRYADMIDVMKIHREMKNFNRQNTKYLEELSNLMIQFNDNGTQFNRMDDTDNEFVKKLFRDNGLSTDCDLYEVTKKRISWPDETGIVWLWFHLTAARLQMEPFTDGDRKQLYELFVSMEYFLDCSICIGNLQKKLQNDTVSENERIFNVDKFLVDLHSSIHGFESRDNYTVMTGESDENIKSNLLKEYKSFWDGK